MAALMAECQSRKLPGTLRAARASWRPEMQESRAQLRLQFLRAERPHSRVQSPRPAIRTGIWAKRPVSAAHGTLHSQGIPHWSGGQITHHTWQPRRAADQQGIAPSLPPSPETVWPNTGLLELGWGDLVRYQLYPALMLLESALPCPPSLQFPPENPHLSPSPAIAHLEDQKKVEGTTQGNSACVPREPQVERGPGSPQPKTLRVRAARLSS